IAAAIAGVFAGLSLITLLGHVVAVPDVAPTVATMIGLGVGIDYSLFIVTRARSARYDGMSVHDAIGQASAIVVVVAVLASMTLLPALLGLCGDRIERLRVGPDRRPTLGHSKLWERWGERLARRPQVLAAGSVVLLLALTAPVMHLGLG